MKYRQPKGSSCNFRGRERKKKKKRFTYDKSNHHRTHMLHQKKANTLILLTTLRKGIFRCLEASHTTRSRHGCLPRVSRCIICSCSFVFLFIYSNTKLFLVSHVNIKKKKKPLKKILKTPLRLGLIF